MTQSEVRYPTVQIGKYYIREIPGSDRLWIGVEDRCGEGGSFPVADVEKIIGEYYDKEF